MRGALPVHLSGRLFMRALLALPCMVLEQVKKKVLEQVRPDS